MLKSMDRFYREAAEHWCHFAHSDSMWPVNGQYRCRTCLRTYPVPWANTTGKAVPPVPHFTAGHATRRTPVDHPKAA